MTRSVHPSPSVPRWRGRSISGLVLAASLVATACTPSGAATGAPSSPATPATASASAAGPTVSAPTGTETPGRTSAAASPSTAPASPGASATTSPASPTGSAAASPTAEADFPVTVTDDEGTAVTVERRPEHIVSLSPANTETVFALGGGDRVVGGTDADDHPEEAKAVPDVATFQGVQIEKVLDLDTDLVLAAGNNFTPPADVARLRALGIPVVVLYPETVDEVFADIELIGDVIGEGDAADAMTADMRARIETIRVAAQAGDAPRVFYQIGSAPDIYGPADESFVADLIELAGGEPITTGDEVSYTMPLERLVEADPEVIIVGDANYGVTPEVVKQRGGAWSQMTAVKEDAVRPVDDVIVTRPGPRLADGLAALASAIEPGLAFPATP